MTEVTLSSRKKGHHTPSRLRGTGISGRRRRISRGVVICGAGKLELNRCCFIHHFRPLCVSEPLSGQVGAFFTP